MYFVCIKSRTFFLGKLGFLKMTRTYPKIQKSLKGSNNEQNVQSFQEKGDDVWNVGGIGG